jgi:hypothetical protein
MGLDEKGSFVGLHGGGKGSCELGDPIKELLGCQEIYSQSKISSKQGCYPAKARPQQTVTLIGVLTTSEL